MKMFALKLEDKKNNTKIEDHDSEDHLFTRVYIFTCQLSRFVVKHPFAQNISLTL